MNNKKNEKKYYKIFIMTSDNYYFIIEKRKLYKSMFFLNIFNNDKTSGNIRNPLFLKNIKSKYLKYIQTYLEYYYDKNDKFIITDNITYYNINKYLQNDFDKRFINILKNDFNNDENLLNMLKYFNIESLNKKIELLEIFIKAKK